MLIVKPYIFKRFEEIVFGFSTKIGIGASSPYYFNLSFNVGDDEETVKKNRKLFFEELGLMEEKIAFQKQVHADKISVVNKPGNAGESDAMITNDTGIGLAISTADCPAIFIYDYKNKIIAAVHSGWRSTEKKILFKTVQKLKSEFNCNPENLVCYIGPHITQNNYEVKKDAAEYFDDKYLLVKNDKIFLNLTSANLDMLLQAGVLKSNIQCSKLCSYAYASLLHSYRRDGKHSGRALGIIAMKENNE